MKRVEHQKCIVHTVVDAYGVVAVRFEALR